MHTCIHTSYASHAHVHNKHAHTYICQREKELLANCSASPTYLRGLDRMLARRAEMVQGMRSFIAKRILAAGSTRSWGGGFKRLQREYSWLSAFWLPARQDLEEMLAAEYEPQRWRTFMAKRISATGSTGSWAGLQDRNTQRWKPYLAKKYHDLEMLQRGQWGSTRRRSFMAKPNFNASRSTLAWLLCESHVCWHVENYVWFIFWYIFLWCMAGDWVAGYFYHLLLVISAFS